MRPALSLLLTASACTTPYTFVTDYGGEFTMHLAPEGEAGVTLDLTQPGMTAAQLEAWFDPADPQALACDAPRVAWALDSATDAPLFGELDVCVPEVAFASTNDCDPPARLQLALSGSDGSLWLDLDPVSNAAAGDQIGLLGEIPAATGLGASGTITATVALGGDCVGEAVPHALSLTWDFPEHDERTARVPEEMCCGPLVGRSVAP